MPLHRRTFLKATAAVGAATMMPWMKAAAQPAGRARRPDVVMIAIEDIAASLSCYGHPLVKTPHMDALAKRGVLFTNGHCQAPVCNPSRASVITGLRCSTLGVYNNPQDWRKNLPANHRTLPMAMREAGYSTAHFGKINHNAAAFKNADVEAGNAFEAAMWDVSEKLWGIEPRQEPKAPSQPYPEGQDSDYLKRAVRWGSIGLSAEEGTDGAVARRAIQYMREERDPGQPMFLAIGFHAPHYKLTPPDEFLAMYPPTSIRLPDYPADDLADVPNDYSYNLVEHHWLTDDEKRELIAAYYGCISYTDWAIGQVVAALEADGRLDDTIICLWGDHGLHMGEHHLWQKNTLFEEATRVPFMMAGPGIARGGVCDQPTELVDIYPTLTDLAGVPVSESLDAISMRPLLADPSRPWKKAAFTEEGQRGNIALRTTRYRYTRWAPGGEELYDHATDPREINNLVNDPAYASTLSELRTLMDGGWQAALPPA